jgi:hypothetical protein
VTNYEINSEVNIETEISDVELMKSRFYCLKQEAITVVHYRIEKEKTKQQLTFYNF